ncbi:hypothetical protein ACYF6T_31755 [Streptomyces sp. 7R007]
MTAGRCSRTLRAALFAAVSVLLAALAHVMMSGQYVPAWALVAGAAGTGTAGWCLAGRERGLPVVVAVVVAAQTALHASFSLAQPRAMGAMGRGSMDMGSTQMPMTGMDMSHMAAMPHASHPAVVPGAPTTGMLAAHLLAALLCGLWLAHGEKAAFRILRAVAGWLAAPLRLPLAVPAAPDRPRAGVRRGGSDPAPRRLHLVHAITSRGPPARPAVA